MREWGETSRALSRIYQSTMLQTILRERTLYSNIYTDFSSFYYSYCSSFRAWSTWISISSLAHPRSLQEILLGNPQSCKLCWRKHCCNSLRFCYCWFSFVLFPLLFVKNSLNFIIEQPSLIYSCNYFSLENLHQDRIFVFVKF
jgi:hypothetical protein